MKSQVELLGRSLRCESSVGRGRRRVKAQTWASMCRAPCFEEPLDAPPGVALAPVLVACRSLMVRSYARWAWSPSSRSACGALRRAGPVPRPPPERRQPRTRRGFRPSTAVLSPSSPADSGGPIRPSGRRSDQAAVSALGRANQARARRVFIGGRRGMRHVPLLILEKGACVQEGTGPPAAALRHRTRRGRPTAALAQHDFFRSL
jgi:hypothetical protein